MKKVILLRLLQRVFLSITYVTYSGLKPSIVEINEQNLKDPVHIPLNSVEIAGIVGGGKEKKKSSDFTAMAGYLFFMDTSIHCHPGPDCLFCFLLPNLMTHL